MHAYQATQDAKSKVAMHAYQATQDAKSKVAMLQPAKHCLKASHCHQHDDSQGLTRETQLSRDSSAGSAGQHKSTNESAPFISRSGKEGQVAGRILKGVDYKVMA